MTWYLGHPGGLVALPNPSRATQTPYDRIGSTHQLLSGGRVRDTFGVKRSWQMSWAMLTRDQVGVLNGFLYGATGLGPYVLLDPEQRNLLPLNVSTATNTTMDTTGFTAENSGAVTTSTNSLSNFTAIGGPWPAAATQTLLITVPTSITANSGVVRAAVDIPVVVGGSYAFSSYVSIAAGATFGMAAVISWLNAAGSSLSSVTGNTVAANSTARTTASGVAPAGAVRARARLIATATNTTGSGFAVYAQGLQFEMASSAAGWVPGLDVPYVVIDGASRTRPIDTRNDYNLTLLEV